jgi:6-phosphogluconolactonase
MLHAPRRLAPALAAVALVLALAPSAMADGGPDGAVYALTNAPGGNAVVAYDRASDGALTPAGTYPTGGAGSGAGLGSQGAVIVAEQRKLLFAVNPGSATVSSFRVHDGGLTLVDTAPSGGSLPTSLAYDHGLLYVLNAGTPNRVSGLRADRDGHLTPIADSARPLSADVTNPAQVGFDDDGETLIVTERLTNRIDSYAVGRDGRLSDPATIPSAGPTPFGFAVTKRDTLLVSEAGAGGGASTYRIGGGLTPVSAMVMTGQRAACWAVAMRDGRYGYVANAGTGNLSGVRIGKDGSATLLDADGVTATTGGNPTDTALSRDSRFLYTRVANLSEIAVFAIGDDGALSARPSLTGTPAGLAGLAAF